MGVDFYNRRREYFAEFLRHTDQKTVTVERLKQGFPRYAPSVAHAVSDGKEVTFLDVGAGSGHSFIPFIGQFKANTNVNFVFEEPNIGMALLFFFNYLGHGFTLDRLNKYAGQKNAGFISATHSLYYVGDWEAKVRQMYDSLAPGGTASIVLSSEEGPLHCFRKKLFPLVDQPLPRSAEQLEGILQRSGIPYVSERVVSSLDVAPILQGADDYNLLSFLLRTDVNDRPELVEPAKFELKCAANHERMHLIDHIIWIQKPGNYDASIAQPREPKKELTLREYRELFREELEAFIGRDIDFLTPELRKSYVNLLLVDSVMRQPIFGAFDFDERNWFYGPDPLNYVIDYETGLLPDDVIVITKQSGGGYSQFERNEDLQNIFWPVMRVSDWSEHFLKRTYEVLPSAEKQQFPNRKTFNRFVFNMFRTFEHFKALGMDGRSVYENMSHWDIWALKLSPEETEHVKKNCNSKLQEIIFSAEMDTWTEYSRVPQPFPIVT